VCILRCLKGLWIRLPFLRCFWRLCRPWSFWSFWGLGGFGAEDARRFLGGIRTISCWGFDDQIGSNDTEAFWLTTPYILYRLPSHVAAAYRNIRPSEAQMRRLYPYRRAIALTKASTPSYIRYRAFRLAWEACIYEKCKKSLPHKGITTYPIVGQPFLALFVYARLLSQSKALYRI